MKKVRLDQAIVERGLTASRTKAAALVMAGQVEVDGQIIDKAGYFVSADNKIHLIAPPPYVSRGGEKLASVADRLNLDFKDRVVLDVGSSTGGFTDYALQHGARQVYAIDVGTGQLDWGLRNDQRVMSMERTDIRNVMELPEPIDIVVIDVSFISLRQILPAVSRLVSKKTKVVAMAKPHFEADYITASKHKGVIKNNTVRREILKRVEGFMKQGFIVEAKADSAVLGRKGNQERFYLLRKV